jgi:hypothetical protein
VALPLGVDSIDGMGRFRKSDPSSNEFYNGKHRFEHWYRDNSVYFLTARCREKVHGSVAKLVNDLLPERRAPFWGNDDHDNYYDGCIRNEKQYRKAYRYTLEQSVVIGSCGATGTILTHG